MAKRCCELPELLKKHTCLTDAHAEAISRSSAPLRRHIQQRAWAIGEGSSSFFQSQQGGGATQREPCLPPDFGFNLRREEAPPLFGEALTKPQETLEHNCLNDSTPSGCCSDDGPGHAKARQREEREVNV